MTKQEQADFSEKMYQLARKNKAWGCGDRIPIQAFDIIEEYLRPAMRAHDRRATYRGPRISNKTRHVPGRTCRCDAKFVSIWYSN